MSTVVPSAARWEHPAPNREARWRRCLRTAWHVFKPPKGHRNIPTAAGWTLILLALGLGSAAYNTASNILFLALALLLSCLLVSGILAMLNFRGLRWRLEVPPRLRAGEAAMLPLHVANEKESLPCIGITFRVRTGEEPARTHLRLPQPLAAGEKTELRWQLTPARRGPLTLHVDEIESKFPFGFLRKIIAWPYTRETLVWPARVPYTFRADQGSAARQLGPHYQRRGESPEIRQLRPYLRGDSLHLVHWKASARQRKLIVSERLEEGSEALLLRVEAPRAHWSDPARLERLTGFAASLAEDLFTHGRLAGVQLGGAPLRPVRQVGDLHAFFDDLAQLAPDPHPTPPAEHPRWPVITFGPGEGPEITAYVDGVPSGRTHAR